MTKKEDASHELVGSVLIKVSKITEWYANGYRTVHGGAIATWVDCLTSLCIYSFDPTQRWSVSINMTTDYVNAGQIDAPLYFRCKVLKIGKNIAFSECLILDEKLRLIASATHKKTFIVQPKM